MVMLLPRREYTGSVGAQQSPANVPAMMVVISSAVISTSIRSIVGSISSGSGVGVDSSAVGEGGKFGVGVSAEKVTAEQPSKLKNSQKGNK